MASRTENNKKGWVRGAGGAAALAAVIVIAGLFAGRGRSPDNAAANPGGSRVEEEPASTRTASLQPAAPQGAAQAQPAPRGSLSPQAKAEKVRALLDEAREAISDDEFERAEKRLTEAQEMDPYSKLVRSLREDLKEEKEEARQEEIRKRISAHHEKGLEALSESDVEGALRAFEAAQKLDPADPRTFRLIEHAHRVRNQQESRQRRQVFREGAPSSQAEAPLPIGIGQRDASASSDRIGHSGRVGEYVVQPEDVLQITVFEEPDLATKARVSRDGEITVPLLGQVAVAGLTVAQAQERLARLFGEDYLVHPQVQVFVDKPRNVFVTGEVHRPGSYPVSVERETTIMEIISMAGGFSEDADLNGTRIIRVESGQKKTLRVRVGDIVRKGDKSQDVSVLPDDIVFVPESFF